MRFVDTSFWIAVQTTRDPHHETARALWSPSAPLVTTNHVLGETWTLLRRRAGHAGAVQSLDAIFRLDRLTVEHVGPTIEADAWAWLRRHAERRYSFVDATSFALMRRMRLREALAFDEDFEAAGFRLARPPGGP